MTVDVVVPERATLRVAVEGRQAAHAALVVARRAAGRAAEMIERLQGEAAKLATAETEAAAYRAERMKAAADDERTPVIMALPRELTDRIRARAEVEAELDAARALHAALLADVTKAEADVATTTRATHETILNVLSSEVEPLALELTELEARASALRQLLVSFDHLMVMLPGMEKITHVRQTEITRQVLRRPPQFSTIQPKPEFIQAWREYYDALAGDPAAANCPTA